MPPAGFKRSRALWDEARRPREKKADEWMHLLRAILYECQPVRGISNQLSPSVALKYLKTTVFPFLGRVYTFVHQTLLPKLWQTIRNLTPRQWMLVGAVLVYFFVVRWIHELLDAGPLLLIVTALVAIFTIGLGEKQEGELSAYSVFNRGFQRLMGSVDVEELVQQHVGGGMMRMAANNMPEGDDNHHDNAPRGRRNHNIPPAQGNDDDEDEEEEDNGPNNNNNNAARKSGKKARRKNRDEKLEQRRQREAARAMGFDGTGGQEELVAMQRLIDDQVAPVNGNGNHNND